MARHTSPEHPTAQRALITLAVAGAALGAGTATASADSIPGLGLNYRPVGVGSADPQAGLRAATGIVGYVTGPVAGLKPNPLAGTGVDPLDNGVGTQLADFRPVGSQTLTRPLAQAPSLGSVPVLGQALGALGH
ncbi:hypothetical protein GCM10018980_07840 [Streptomyces capoamus]|uniref:Secreted protein n=1 Tax=Streptomyces capoamus TaxID=68183 RepID=A0A919EV98_9ACTN|nr:hypothetical protein [Streptomyces capoamus]GGW17435.1 hypothetical protein GCM10010501_37990 [Streptomyces libani subsp. rufus]GHG36780.1 hypothetical protein GCM10018980_07840 [Streptomyces capoamus]